MRKFIILPLSYLGMMLSIEPSQARVNIAVDLAAQTMQVSSSSGSYVWPISSARSGYNTPTGSYGVQRMEVMHRSHKYHNSPMPHSLFFKGGYAIHGSYAVGSLGSPASHGCVRLSPGHAAQLYDMVRAEGASITISGRRPARGDVDVARGGNPEAVASDRSDRAPTTRRVDRRDRSYARLSRPREPALGYAPVIPAPTYRTWIENPFGAVLEGD